MSEICEETETKSITQGDRTAQLFKTEEERIGGNGQKIGKEYDEIPVEYIYDEMGDGYWIIRHLGQSGNEDNHITKEELKKELKQVICPYDEKKQPEKNKEWWREYEQKKRQQIQKQHHYYTIEKPFKVECQKCGATWHEPPTRDYSVPYQAVMEYRIPNYCPECERKSVFQTLIPKPPDVEWSPIQLNNQWEKLKKQKIDLNNYDLTEDYYTIREIPQIVKQAVVFPEDVEATIFSLAAIASWKLNAFNTTPYIGLWGPPDSGKSQALKLFGKLAYHAQPLATISTAALARVIERYRASVLADEIHDHLNAKNPDASKLQGILKTGFMRGWKYTVCEREGEGIESREVFGVKAFTGERPFTGSISRRCVNIFMEEAEPPIEHISELQHDLTEIRCSLLSYKLFASEPPKLTSQDRIAETENGAFKLRGGIMQVFGPILRVAKQFDMDLEPIIKYAYKQEIKHKRELLESDDAEVVYYIYKRNQENVNQLLVSTIAQECDITNKKGNPSPTRVGWILKNLDLETKRTRNGKAIQVDTKHNKERLSYLYDKFKVKKVEMDRADVEDESDIESNIDSNLEGYSV